MVNRAHGEYVDTDGTKLLTFVKQLLQYGQQPLKLIPFPRQDHHLAYSVYIEKELRHPTDNQTGIVPKAKKRLRYHRC